MRIKSDLPAKVRLPMRAGERKLFVMRTFSGAAAALAIAGALAGVSAADAPKYRTAEAAFERGLGAYKAGAYETAVTALEQSVAEGSEVDRFFAEFYLARIYSGTGPL